jgi:SAM-dependent methyltransferase
MKEPMASQRSMNCKICGNTENNVMHQFREMLFGTREWFDYLECGSCGTIQLAQDVDLAKHYPNDYYSFGATPDISNRSRARRFVTSSVGKYFVGESNLIGKIVSSRRGDMRQLFPEYLRNPLLDLRLDSKILDVGCGAGHSLVALRYFGFNGLAGVDPFIESEITIDNSVVIRKCQLNELDDAFDLIMFNHSLEHVADPEADLRSAHRLLADSGYCLVRIPLVSWAWEEFGGDWVALDPPRHLYLFNESGFRMVAEKAGFAVDEVKYDSTSYQFWASTQISRDIRICDGLKGGVDYLLEQFGGKQMREWEAAAGKLNSEGKGDQASFYLRRV